MRFEWDEAKNESNIAKHRLSFEAARATFEDPYAMSVQDRVVDGELRWQTLGEIDGAAVLVAHTWSEGDDGEVIRLISARKANRKEKRAYAENRRRASE